MHCENAFEEQVPSEKEIIIHLLKILFVILSCKMEIHYSSKVVILVIRIHRERRKTKLSLSVLFTDLLHTSIFSPFFPPPFFTSVVSCQSVLSKVSKESMALMSKLHMYRNFREKIKINWFLILWMSFLEIFAHLHRSHFYFQWHYSTLSLLSRKTKLRKQFCDIWNQHYSTEWLCCGEVQQMQTLPQCYSLTINFPWGYLTRHSCKKIQ